MYHPRSYIGVTAILEVLQWSSFLVVTCFLSWDYNVSSKKLHRCDCHLGSASMEFLFGCDLFS